MKNYLNRFDISYLNGEDSFSRKKWFFERISIKK